MASDDEIRRALEGGKTIHYAAGTHWAFGSAPVYTGCHSEENCCADTCESIAEFLRLHKTSLDLEGFEIMEDNPNG